MAASASVRFDADTAGYERGLKRMSKDTATWQKQQSKHFANFGNSMKTLGKVGVLAGAGLAAMVAKSGFQDLAKGQQVMAQSQAVIKSTGGIANVTAKHMQGLADSIERKTGMESEAIQSGTNMLATFTNIRNGAGKTGKVFDDATNILADMSQAMGTDAKSQAIQLGKALNDPVKGVGALSKVGVTFSDSQKKMISGFVKTGDTAKAQQVILAELRKEFGGSAAAYGTTMPGQLAKAKNAFGNLSGSIVSAFLPSINKGLAGVNGFIAKIQAWSNSKAGQAALAKLHSGFTKLGGVVKTAAGYLATAGKWLVKNKDTMIPLTGAILAGIGAYKTYMLITKAAAGAQVALNLAMSLNPVGLVIAAVAGLAVGFYTLYKRSETFRDIIGKIKDVGVAAFKLLWTILKNSPIGLVIQAIKKLVDHFGGFKAVASAVGGFFSKVILGMRLKVLEFAQKALSVLAKIPGPMQDNFKRAAANIKGDIADTQKKIDSVNTKKARKETDALDTKVGGVWGKVKGWVGSIGNFFGGIAGGLRNTRNKAPERDAFFPGYNGKLPAGLVNQMGLPLGLGQMMGLSMSSGYRAGAVTKSGAKSDHSTGHAVDMVGSPGAMAGYYRAAGNLPGLKQRIYSPLDGWSDDHYDHVHVAMFRRGGRVPGADISGDTVPALLQPGEFVINRKAANSIGHSTLDTWNRYRAGGRVSKAVRNARNVIGSTKSLVAGAAGRYAADNALPTVQLEAAKRALANIMAQQAKLPALIKAKEQEIALDRQNVKQEQAQVKSIEARLKKEKKGTAQYKALNTELEKSKRQLAGFEKALAADQEDLKGMAERSTELRTQAGEASDNIQQLTKSVADAAYAADLHAKSMIRAAADVMEAASNMISDGAKSWTRQVVPIAADLLKEAQLRLHPTVESLSAILTKDTDRLNATLARRQALNNGDIQNARAAYDNQKAVLQNMVNYRMGLGNATEEQQRYLDAYNAQIEDQQKITQAAADVLNARVEEDANLAQESTSLADSIIGLREQVEEMTAATQAATDAEYKTAYEALRDALREGGNIYRPLAGSIHNHFTQTPNAGNWLSTQEYLLGLR